MDRDTTAILRRVSDGDPGAIDALFPVVYDRLKSIAAEQLRHERVGHTLDATALVHEAFLKLNSLEKMSLEGTAHFFAIAARAIRQILVDHARARARLKRGGGARRLTLATGHALSDDDGVDMLALDDALTELRRLHERQARIVELRFFAGMSIDQVATALEISPRTVDGDWAMARAWLRRRLADVAYVDDEP